MVRTTHVTTHVSGDHLTTTRHTKVISFILVHAHHVCILSSSSHALDPSVLSPTTSTCIGAPFLGVLFHPPPPATLVPGIPASRFKRERWRQPSEWP